MKRTANKYQRLMNGKKFSTKDGVARRERKRRKKYSTAGRGRRHKRAISVKWEEIKKILQGLSYYDLVTATQVCHCWSSVGNTILQKERRLKFTTIHPNNLPNTDLKAPYSNSTNLEVLENFLSNLSKNKSFYCFGFSHGDWLSRNDIVTKFSPDGTSLCNLLKKALPKKSVLTLVCATGVIGSVEQSSLLLKQLDLAEDSHNDPTNKNREAAPFNGVAYSIELEEFRIEPICFAPAELNGVSLLLLPKQPGVKINIVNLKEKDFHNMFRADSATHRAKRSPLTAAQFDSAVGLDPRDPLKAFLVFTDDLHFGSAFVKAAQERQNENVALGGGLVETMLDEAGQPFRGAVAVTVCGENVRAASVVVSPRVESEAALVVQLQKLKDARLPEDHSVCFVFACCARGWRRYDKENVEASALRALFPRTPILGFFGEGEIGCNYYPKEGEGDAAGEAEPKRRKRKKQNLFHEYSTAVVLVSFL